MSLQERQRRRAIRLIILMLASSLTSATPPLPPLSHAPSSTDSAGDAREGEGTRVADGHEGVGLEGMGWELTEQVLVPLAKSLDAHLVLEACNGLLQLTRLLQLPGVAATAASSATAHCTQRWALVVAEGSLFVLARNDSDSAACMVCLRVSACVEVCLGVSRRVYV